MNHAISATCNGSQMVSCVEDKGKRAEQELLTEMLCGKHYSCQGSIVLIQMICYLALVEAQERSSAALSVMNVVIAGSLSFALLDKLCASFANAGTPMWYSIYIIRPFIEPPWVWFVVYYFA
jgi:hypothetical protein